MDCTNQLSTLKSIPQGLAPLPLSHVTFLLGDRINIQNIIDSLLIACLIIFSTCLAVLTDLSHQYVLEAWKCNTITVFYLIIELRHNISIQYWPEYKNQHDQEINFQHQSLYLIFYFASFFFHHVHCIRYRHYYNVCIYYAQIRENWIVFSKTQKMKSWMQIYSNHQYEIIVRRVGVDNSYEKSF